MCVCSALSSHCCCVFLLRMHTSRAPQFEPQVYTYPSHSYINSYHSVLMLQFSAYQNHLNPDLLSDRVWMKTMWSSTTVMQGVQQQTTSHMGFLRGDQDSETELYLAGHLLVMVFQLPVMMVSVSVCMDIQYMYVTMYMYNISYQLFP